MQDSQSRILGSWSTAMPDTTCRCIGDILHLLAVGAARTASKRYSHAQGHNLFVCSLCTVIRHSFEQL